MNRPKWVAAIAGLAMVAGCAVAGLPKPSPTPIPPSANAFGWRFVNLSALGDSAQLRGLSAKGTQLYLTAGTNGMRNGAIDTVYKAAPYHVSSGALKPPFEAAAAPLGYEGTYQLAFGLATFANSPVPVTIVSSHGRIPLPKQVPAYQSLITPETAPAGSYDTAILGQSGEWLWLALTGPEKPRFSLVWGYRTWTRLLALNTTTGKHVLYPIPPSTNRTSTFGVPPAFATANGVVWIATQDWIGRFPANPLTSAHAPILTAPPRRIVAARQAAMLRSLTTLRNRAADGIARYWDHTVMGSHVTIPTSHEPGGSMPWIMDPVIQNHGDYPQDIYWAARFPLTPGSQADKQRTMLFHQIFRMGSNPLTVAAVMYPSQIRAQFHSQPPMTLPGYTIRDNLYLVQVRKRSK